MVACRMKATERQHQPVLCDEVLSALCIKPSGVYVDATFGRGGHSELILKSLGPTGRLLGFDKDPEAVTFANQYFTTDKRFTIHHASFTELSSVLIREGLLGKVNGILFDLGVSSPQFDNPARGFSFSSKGPLDMRMDFSKGTNAATWLATVSEKQLADVLWQYGEERFSRQIARAIVKEREMTPISDTEQLAKIVAKALPVWQKGKHPATRSFQAIRIVINQELDELQGGLTQSLNALCVGGRLLVISFHSLEDRIVKQFMQYHERGDEFPAKLPVKHKNLCPQFKRVGRAIKPNLQEIKVNPRARSAVLRVGEKLS